MQSTNQPGDPGHSRAVPGLRLLPRPSATALSRTAVVLAIASASAVVGLAGFATAASLSPLQSAVQLVRDAPAYLRFTYAAALAAPLPLPTAARDAADDHTGKAAAPLPPSQTYPNAGGSLGVYQTSGSVVPAANAFFQSLGSNGRSCFSCHQQTDGMSLSLATIQRQFTATNGRDPMFAPVDGANCPSSVPRSQTAPALAGGRMGGSAGSGQQALSDAHSLLLNKGLFRVFLPVPTHTADFSALGGPPSHPVEFTVAVVRDPYGCNTDPAYAQQVDPVTQEVRQMVSVYRRPRMSANLKFMTTPGFTLGGGGLPNIDFIDGMPVVDPLTGAAISGNIMWDGREPTLESQARSATLGHAQATRAPTDAQVAQMVAYEKSVYAAQSAHSVAGDLTQGDGKGGPMTLAVAPVSFGSMAVYDNWPIRTGAWASQGQAARASIARGQSLFNARGFSVNNVAGFNNTVLLNTPNPARTTCASCHGNRPAGSDPFPAGQRDIGIGGHAVALNGPAPSDDLPLFKLTCKPGYRTPYYGQEVVTNDPGLALITGRCADIGRRSVPQLRALAARAPYFSDGSAADLEDVVRVYNKRFNIGLSRSDVADLTNFLKAL